MIEHPRNMMNAVGALGDTQKKIVILRAVKLRLESANLSHKIPTQKDHVTQVITGQKEVWGPVGLQYWEIETCLSQFVFVRVDQIDSGIFLKQLYILEKGIGLKNIIMIEKRDPFATSEIEAFV